MSLVPGVALGPYRILEKIGEGGMGEVYRARDTQLKRDVALKVLPAALTADAARLARFTREAELLAALNHPHIVTIHAILESPHGQAIVMELIQGPTLRALVADRPGSDEAVRLGAQVATALAAAHAAGLVHRDLKPENVMVRHDGYVKVLDFGLARLAPDGAGPSAAETGLATAPGAVMGTWRYMAPEQARDAAVTGAADVFALGLVLYELATGRHPFEADSNLEVLHRITSDPPAPASRLNPTVPAALDTLIDSMLAKEPRRRPTAAAVAETLTALTARAVMSTPPPAVPRARRTTVGRLAERQALLAAFEAVAAERGLVVGIAGEAGIGKTTLVEEFVTDLAAGGHACTLARGRCSERLAGTEAYLPWLEALESLVRGEGGPARAGLLKTAAPTWYAQVMPLAPDDSSAARLLADVKTASQERLKRELAAFLEELGRQCPVVLFFDDLHWADASTVDLLAYVAGRFDRVRALVVATYRPAELALAAHPFGASKLDLAARGVARELALGFLARDEVEQYVGLTFPGHRFPPAFTELVHAKTEGNPLFVADLLRELRDRGILAEREGAWALTRELAGVERELPTSVRSLIERKIAQVGDADRRLLQAASVQGCDFDSAVAARALGMDAADVEDRLEALERVHALVSRVEESLLPDGTPNLRSRFVHVLYQNALYDSLTPSRRAALSRAVAEALLGHCGARKADLAASLALLFETARDVDRSVRFFTVAAEHAADKSAHQESSALARRGLAAAGLLPEGSARAELELPLLLALGTAETVLHGWATHEVEQLFRRARSISKQLGRSEALVGALWGLGSVYYVRADYRTGITFVEQMFDLATQFEDPIVELYAEWGLGAACHNMGQLTASRSHLERAVELYDPSRAQGLTVRFGLDAGAGAHAYLNLVLTLLGYPDRAVNAGHTAVHLARGLSHPFTLAYTLTYVAQGDLIRRSASRAEGHAVEADGLCGEHGLALRPHARFLRAVAQTGAVPDERLMGEMSRALDALADQRAASGQPNFLAWLAQLAGKCGQVNEALDSIDRALAAAEQHAERYFEPEVHRIKGELLLKRDPPNGAEAERSFLRAIDVARGQEARWWELRASVSLGRLWQRQGRRDEARALVAAIYGWFTEGFETVDLKEARALLEGLEDRPHLARSAPASIVVLPFANLSSDLEQEYFSDGLTEEIIADLSQVRALRVISRTSAMHYKGTTKPLPTIAQELNVRHVLEGSVRKAGNNLRITAQLIDASTDAHLWAEKYSGTLDDVFDMQEKVSRAIVGALRATLAPDEDRRLTERPLPNSLAYDAYLRARQDIARWTEPALDRAQKQLEQALALVGDHPVLLAGIGSVHFTRYFGAFQMDDETLQKAEDHARRAVGMDPAVAEGHFVLGMIGWAQGRMRTAFDELRLALSLNPSDTDAMSYLAEIACYVGKPVTSGPLVERLLEIDPLASNTYVTSVFHHVYNGRFDAALEPARTAFRLDPESHRTRFAYFLACMSAGRSAESAPMVERWRREAPDHSWPELVNAWLAAERGEEIPVSRRTLEVAWMDMSAAGHGVPTVYAMLGRTDEALRWLTRGVDLGFINYPFFAHLEPRFESLRGDERFQRLMVRVKREWEAFEA